MATAVEGNFWNEAQPLPVVWIPFLEAERISKSDDNRAKDFADRSHLHVYVAEMREED